MRAAIRKLFSDSLPDFVKLAEAYGWKGIRIEEPDRARRRHRRR